MPDRFVVSEVQQIGVESTPGSAAVPTILFQGLNVDIDTNLQVDEFKPSGQLPQSIVAPRQEWSSGALSGFPTYTEIAYALSNLLGAAVIAAAPRHRTRPPAGPARPPSVRRYREAGGRPR
jgi:hypothetical protein